MPEKSIDAATFQTRIDQLTRANKQLDQKYKTVAEELKLAKESLLNIKADFEARVKHSLAVDIQGMLGCSDNELQKLIKGKTVDQLEQMAENFATAVDSRKSPYIKPATASIRPGSSAPFELPGGIRLTVGSTFGKTQKEIAEMGGEF